MSRRHSKSGIQKQQAQKNNEGPQKEMLLVRELPGK